MFKLLFPLLPFLIAVLAPTVAALVSDDSAGKERASSLHATAYALVVPVPQRKRSF